MPRVDFYILPTDQKNHLLSFSCRLTEKAFRHGHTILLYTSSEEFSDELDNLLWEHSTDSFLAHQKKHASGNHSPILIDNKVESSLKADLLINLSDKIPEQQNNFNRIAEIILNNEQEKAIKRQHYQLYKQQNYQVHSHNLSK